MQLFPCKQEKKSVLSTKKLVNRYIALSRERLLVLQAHETKLGHATVRSNHHLTELAKLSYHKSQPKRLVLFYKLTVLNKDGQAQAALRPRVFHVDEAAALVKCLIRYIKAFR